MGFDVLAVELTIVEDGARSLVAFNIVLAGAVGASWEE